MRWLLGGLIGINLLVFVLQLLFRSDEPAQTQPAPNPPTISASSPKIQLLSEIDAGTLGAMRSSPQRKPSQQAPENPLCTLVGPFSRLLRAEYFVERLTAIELQAQVRELEIPGETTFWVYMPSQGNKKQAFNVLRELQAKGIDSYVIPKGELENGISFGMFSQKTLAEKQQQTMVKAGYQAELSEVVRTYKEIWVVLPPGQASQLSTETWQKMMLEEEDQLELRQNYCPSVASE